MVLLVEQEIDKIARAIMHKEIGCFIIIDIVPLVPSVGVHKKA